MRLAFRSVYGFEINSAVKKYIDENYVFEAEVNGARIYLRKNVTSVKKSWVAHGFHKHPDRTEGFRPGINQTWYGYSFQGWMLFNVGTDNLKNQNERCILYNQTDTVLIDSYKK